MHGDRGLGRAGRSARRRRRRGERRRRRCLRPVLPAPGRRGRRADEVELVRLLVLLRLAVGRGRRGGRGGARALARGLLGREVVLDVHVVCGRVRADEVELVVRGLALGGGRAWAGGAGGGLAGGERGGGGGGGVEVEAIAGEVAYASSVRATSSASSALKERGRAATRTA